MQKEQMKHQMGMEAKQAEFAAKQGMTEAQIQAQMQMAQMKQQPMQGGM
jgi:Xaa-Pro aminopeptidase